VVHNDFDIVITSASDRQTGGQTKRISIETAR